MSESKHTPGPWVMEIGDVPALGKKALGVLRSNHVEGNTESSICVIALEGDIDSEDLANACLIAAAPEMLDALDCQALRDLLGYLEDGPDNKAWALACVFMGYRDSVIAKATRKEVS